MKPQNRVIIASVSPEIDGGRYRAKGVVGERIAIEADIYADGHTLVAARLFYRHERQRKWQSTYFKALTNDRWSASILLEKQGVYQYRLEGWVDHALNWQYELGRKVEDGQQVTSELLDGVQYLQRIAKAGNKTEKAKVSSWIAQFENETLYKKAVQNALSEALTQLFRKYPYTDNSTTYAHTLEIYVDRAKARFSSWYEFFPRSSASEPGQHGTFKECEALIPRVAKMGFDTLYFPPVHPIGVDHRKGRNNATTAEPGEPGSPWAIGAAEGGHKDLHPELGTLKDFKRLIKTAKDHGIEIAMDYALQCSPNHPYVKAHPEWFRWRPDGSVQYAENPPKKYQDILPINFETEAWKSLWDELKSILIYWIEQGIQVFRVDNPHTKSFVFWEWVIAEVKKQYPDVLFLSEAFTRPRVMHQLAKVGFTQSYSYFTWRNTKAEWIEYMEELTQSPSQHYFRPNFWPNTPDINPYHLQGGNETIYLTRFFLAATLSSNYGIYGPVFEQIVHDAVPGKEEYLNSEKYEVHHWDWTKTNKLKEVISVVNRARKENPALHITNNFKACAIENPNLLAYYKADQESGNHLLCVANLDPHNTQSGWVQLPLDALGAKEGDTLVMHDLVSGDSYQWNKEWNYVELNPYRLPFHLFRISKN